MEKLEIPTNKPKKEFKKHLSIDNNHRIIFSGVFGIGKTKFLKTYFEDKNKEYNSIFISPVNYSIAKN